MPRRWLPVLLGTAIVVLASPAYGAPGDLRAGFGDGGALLLHAPAGQPASMRLTSISMSPDGRSTVAGYTFGPSGGSAVVGRVTPSGRPDPAFNGGNMLAVPGSGDDVEVAALAGGAALVLAHDVTGAQLSLTRLTAAGAPDHGFGAGGTVTFNVPGYSSTQPTALAVLSGGRPLVASYLALYDSTGSFVRRDFALIRFTAGGDLDRSFDGDGVVISPFRVIRSLLALPDDRSIGVGHDAGFFSGRLNGFKADGSPDAAFSNVYGIPGSFGLGGPDSSLTGVARAPDGTTTVVGNANGFYPYAVRLAARPFVSFEQDKVFEHRLCEAGCREPSNRNHGFEVEGVVNDPSARAYLVGTNTTYAPPTMGPPAALRSDAGLMVLDAAGNGDPIVGGSPAGWRAYNVPGNGWADFRAIARAPDGDLLLAGAVGPAPGDIGRAAVLRMEPAPPLAGGSAGGGGSGSASSGGSRPGGEPRPSPAAGRVRWPSLLARVSLKRGRGTITVKCLAPARHRCTISLTLRVKRVLIGRVRGTVRGQRTGKLTVRLTRRGVTRLRKARRHRLRVRAAGTSKTSGSPAVTINRRLTLAGR